MLNSKGAAGGSQNNDATTASTSAEVQTDQPVAADTTDSSIQAVQPTDENFMQTEVAKPGTSTESQTDQPVVADTTDSSIQAVQPTDENFMQTEGAKQETQSSQTDNDKCVEKSSQTLIVTTRETYMQTKAKKFVEVMSQTKKDEAEKHSQTNIKVFADYFMQTDEAPIENRAMQTQPASGVGILQQTDPTPVAHHKVQTDPTPISEAMMQTDPTPLGDKNIQVQCDMQERHMQTVYMGNEKESQTVILTKMRATQTIIKQFAEMDVQTERLGKDAVIQTSREFLRDTFTETEPMIVIDPEEQCEMDSQTEHVKVINPSDQYPKAAQTDTVKVIYPESMIASTVQTDNVRVIDPNSEIEHAIQTDEVYIRDSELQSEVDTQTDPVSFTEQKELVEEGSQTTLVWVVSLQQRQAEEEEEKIMQASEPVKPGEEPVVESEAHPPPPELEAAPVDNPLVTPGDNESMKIEGQQLTPKKSGFLVMEEKHVQTDPVTIIIGDSSFLVKKLERYANKEPSVRMLDSARRGGRRVATRGGRLHRPVPPAPPHLQHGMPGDLEGPPELMPELTDGVPDEQRGEMPILAVEDEELKPLEIKPEFKPVVRQRGGHRAGPSRHYSHIRPKPLEKKDLTPVSKKGRFNCPFCTLMFNESALLYKHLQATHGTPRASNRRARRKGTIIITPDGQRIVENGGPARKPISPRRSYKPVQISPSSAGYLNDELMPGETREATVGMVENGAVSQEMMDVIETPLLGRRAFSCPFCPKTFTKSSALYVHLQNSHKAERNRIRSPRSGTSRYKIINQANIPREEGQLVEEEVEEEYVEDEGAELLEEYEGKVVHQTEEIPEGEEAYPPEEGEIHEEGLVVPVEDIEEIGAQEEEIGTQEEEIAEQEEEIAEPETEIVEQEELLEDQPVDDEDDEGFPEGSELAPEDAPDIEEVQGVDAGEEFPEGEEVGEEYTEEGVEEEAYIPEVKDEDDIKQEDEEVKRRPGRPRGRPPGKRKRVEEQPAVVPKKRKTREPEQPDPDSLAARRSRRSSGANETIETRKKSARMASKTTPPGKRGRPRKQ